MADSDREPLSPLPSAQASPQGCELISATLDSLLDLMRRLPPTKVEENVNTLCEVCPDYADDLLGNVDQPLKVLRDEESGKQFLGCDYNRDGDSFRSPWSNTYIPASPGGPVPSSKLRQLEQTLNSAFDTYREMYFEGGTSSVYLWDLEDEGVGKETSFAGVVLMKKGEPTLSPFMSGHNLEHVSEDQGEGRVLMEVLPADNDAPSGTWDSLHVFECHERGRSAKYKLTSTVMLVLGTKTSAVAEKVEGDGKGNVTLSGSMTRQAEVDYPLTSSAGHVPNIGRIVEDMEWVHLDGGGVRGADGRIKMRNLLSSVYFGKTKDVVNELRSQSGLEAKSREDMFRAELAARMGGRKLAT